MKTQKKQLLPWLLLFSLFAIIFVIGYNKIDLASARNALQTVSRTRYISNILRITDGVMPVLWISPQYGYESKAKYFDLSGNANHALQSTAANQPKVKPPGLEFDGDDDYLNCYDSQTQVLTRRELSREEFEGLIIEN